MDFQIRNQPVLITNIGERGEVELDIGGLAAVLIEPKPTLVYTCNYVPLCDVDILNGPFWEQIISIKKNERILKGCTDDPRIVEIAKRQIEGKITDADIGKVYPPLKRSDKIE